MNVLYCVAVEGTRCTGFCQFDYVNMPRQVNRIFSIALLFICLLLLLLLLVLLLLFLYCIYSIFSHRTCVFETKSSLHNMHSHNGSSNGKEERTNKRISYELRQLMNWNKSMFSFGGFEWPAHPVIILNYKLQLLCFLSIPSFSLQLSFFVFVFLLFCKLLQLIYPPPSPISIHRRYTAIYKWTNIYIYMIIGVYNVRYMHSYLFKFQSCSDEQQRTLTSSNKM